MERKLIFPIVSGGLIIALGVVFFIIPRRDVAEKPDAPLRENPLELIESDLRESRLRREHIAAVQGLAEELEARGQSVLGIPKIQFDFALNKGLEARLEEQEKKAAQITSLPIYVLQTEFGDEFLEDLGEAIGVDKSDLVKTVDEQSGKIILSNLSENKATAGANGLSMIIFSPVPGSFRFLSTGGLGQSKSSDPVLAAQEFLKENAVLKSYAFDLNQDETTTYRRKSAPDITFVAFRRGGGLPFLNAYGLSQIKKLGSSAKETIGFEENKALIPSDPDIVETTDQTDGLARLDDFNSITLLVDNTSGAIIGGQFNIRPVNYTGAAKNIISAKEALRRGREGKIYKLVVTPRGQGTFNKQAVYPDGLAVSKNAQINSAYLSYLEEPLSGRLSSIFPVYMFKGTARLETGYFVDFSFVSPAIRESEGLALSGLSVSADTFIHLASMNEGMEVAPEQFGGAQAAFAPAGTFRCDSTQERYQPTCPPISSHRTIDGRIFASQAQPGRQEEQKILWEVIPRAQGESKVGEFSKRFLRSAVAHNPMFSHLKTTLDSMNITFGATECFQHCQRIALNLTSGI